MTDTCTQAEPSKAMTTVLPATTPPKRPTKKAQLIKLLSCKLGTDVATISAKFGWQPHTTRAALSGLSKVGFEITKENADADKPVRYRIIRAHAVASALGGRNAE